MVLCGQYLLWIVVRPTEINAIGKDNLVTNSCFDETFVTRMLMLSGTWDNEGAQLVLYSEEKMLGTTVVEDHQFSFLLILIDTVQYLYCMSLSITGMLLFLFGTEHWNNVQRSSSLCLLGASFGTEVERLRFHLSGSFFRNLT